MKTTDNFFAANVGISTCNQLAGHEPQPERAKDDAFARRGRSLGTHDV